MAFSICLLDEAEVSEGDQVFGCITVNDFTVEYFY